MATETTAAGRQLQSAQRARLWTLRAGFGGMLLLICALGTDVALLLREYIQCTTALRAQSRERSRLVGKLREDIYHSAAVVRDYLIEDDDARVVAHRAELEQLPQRINAHMEQFRGNAPETARDTVGRLSAGIRLYVDAVRETVSWPLEQRHSRREEVLRNVIIPNRAQLVDLVHEITTLNNHELDSAESRLNALQSQLGRRIVLLASTVLLFGVFLTMVAMRRVNTLERESAVHFNDLQQGHEDLTRLSDMLLAAQEEERLRISRELHDEIGQTISGALLRVSRLEPSRFSNHAAEEAVSELRRSLENCLRAVRDMALLLRPSMLDDLGLTAALHWQVREVMRRTSLDVRLNVSGPVDELPDAHKICVYRVLQEALGNCVRHAQAKQVRINLSCRESRMLTLVVKDDGIGFDPGKQKGLGLVGMTERIHRLNGAVSIESKPGHGTVLAISLPLTVRQPVAA